MSIDSLSLFFPTFNEEANIKQTVFNAVKVLKSNFKNWELIIVNDGSNDTTREIAEKMSKEDKENMIASYTPYEFQHK